MSIWAAAWSNPIRSPVVSRATFHPRRKPHVNKTKLLASVGVAGVALPVAQTSANQPPCSTKGKVYVLTGRSLENNGFGEIFLPVTGPLGVQRLTFASGTSQFSIIGAINSFAETTGVGAAQSATHPAMIELTTIASGADQFVCVSEVDRNPISILYADPDGEPTNKLCVAGTDGIYGDQNCDGAVDAMDTGLVIVAWGSADPVADVTGDGVVDALDLGEVLGAWTGAVPLD